MTDEAAARRIRDDEIDILIDLNGLTAGSRLQILRWRPAPVQATYLGFIGPIPLPELDYLLCDSIVVPPSVAALYEPASAYIAEIYQANDSKRSIGAATTRADGRTTRGSFHILLLLQPLQDHRGNVRRLDGDPAAGRHRGAVADRRQRLVLRQPAPARRAAGIDPERMIFAGRVDPADYMARLALPDLFLDTSPYNAGTIASDAIRMGLPLVTLSGQSFASRMAGRLLHAIGADRGIAARWRTTSRPQSAWPPTQPRTPPTRRCSPRPRWAETIGDIAGFTAAFEAALLRLQATLEFRRRSGLRWRPAGRPHLFAGANARSGVNARAG